MAETLTYQEPITASKVHELRNSLIGEGAAKTSDVHTVLAHGLSEFTTFGPEVAAEVASRSITDAAGYTTEQGGEAVLLELEPVHRAQIAGLLTRTAFEQYSSLSTDQKGLLAATARAVLPVLPAEAHGAYDMGLHTKLVINPNQS